MSQMDRMMEKMHCNFIGHLASEPEACVAVTGCPGNEMSFSIFSKNPLRSHRFVVHPTGEMVKVESPVKNNKNAFASPLRIPQHMRNKDDWVLADGDELANPDQIDEEMAIEESCASGNCTGLPETNLLTVKVGYEDSFYHEMGSADAASTFLDSVFTHVQTFFCHDSLGSKIKLEVKLPSLF